jgi:hypothetical protein
MILFEIVLSVAFLVGVVYLLSRFFNLLVEWLRIRERAKLAQERREERQATAERAKDLVQEILLDREMAFDVYQRLREEFGDRADH